MVRICESIEYRRAPGCGRPRELHFGKLWRHPDHDGKRTETHTCGCAVVKAEYDIPLIRLVGAILILCFPYLYYRFWSDRVKVTA